jgi:hypothetical protein
VGYISNVKELEPSASIFNGFFKKKTFNGQIVFYIFKFLYLFAGMYSATSGSVHINGYNIHENLDKVRESLGLCPQHNMLFSDLTVMEHLLFFAMVSIPALYC